MTEFAKDQPPLIESIPDPAAIRSRLEELRTEARILCELLPVAERSQRMSLKASAMPIRLFSDLARQGDNRR